MKVYIIITICALLNLSVTAQDFKVIGTSGTTVNYDIKLPEDAEPWMAVSSGTGTPRSSEGKKATTVFIEFGDGTFSFLSNGKHDFLNATPNRGIITKTTGIYTGGGKPPAHRVDRPMSGTTPYTSMNIIPGISDNLAIIPNIGSVLARDTMIFVVTYKLTDSGRSLLLLFNDNLAKNVFENVTVGQTMVDEVTGKSANFLRTYSDERETTSASISTVNTIRTNNSQYVNALVLNNLNNDGNEHNVFITLIPKENLLSSYVSETTIKAILVGNRGKFGIIATTEKTITLPIVDKSHDPNYITVKPACMLLPKAGKELDYHIHFQNTGTGPASKVRVAVKIPDNVNMNTDIKYEASWYKMQFGTIDHAGPYINSTNDSLVFTFVSNSGAITLEGMTATPTNMCSQTTMGDIWFKVKTNNSMPDNLFAQVSILFYNSDPNEPPNKAVLTNVALAQFRECCDCNQSCDPCKKKKGLWKWLFCKKC